MAINKKIGFSIFLHDLKKLGVFEEYTRNFLLFHNVSSPLRIQMAMERDYNFKARLNAMRDELNTPEEWHCFYIKNFSSYAVSFNWMVTQEGDETWRKIFRELNRLINYY